MNPMLNKLTRIVVAYQGRIKEFSRGGLKFSRALKINGKCLFILKIYMPPPPGHEFAGISR